MNSASKLSERALSAVEGQPLPHAQLYTRSNCTLCERVYPILVRLAAESLLTFELIDITSDPALMERYKWRIPVLSLSTGDRFEGRISEFRLRRRLTLDVA